MGGGGGTKQDFAQSERFARIARQQYSDMATRADPLELQIRQGLDPSRQLPKALNMADTAVNQAFGTQRAAFGMDMARQGIMLRPDEQAAAGRTFNLAEASERAATANAARQGVRDRALGLMTGGLASNMVQKQMMGAK